MKLWKAEILGIILTLGIITIIVACSSNTPEKALELESQNQKADLVATYDEGRGKIWRYIDAAGNGSTYCYVTEATQAVSISCAWRP